MIFYRYTVSNVRFISALSCLVVLEKKLWVFFVHVTIIAHFLQQPQYNAEEQRQIDAKQAKTRDNSSSDGNSKSNEHSRNTSVNSHPDATVNN